MKIIVMKLTDGTEVVAGVSDTSGTVDNLHVDKPRVLFHDGNQGGLMPYFISAPDQKNIPIAKSNIIASFEAPKPLADSYLQMTTSILLG